ncbi:MAG: hypothetical protein R2747_22470 [Pyrinomonadaceae bacterium]
MIKKITVTALSVLIILVLSGFPAAQNKTDVRKKSVDQLVADFVSNDWIGRVVPAKEELESRGSESIPQIIALLDQEKEAPLKNTADLIYPGAKEFYGHGWIVDYDVDRISVRAGWFLESLTFQDFGFQSRLIDHDDLLQAVIKSRGNATIKDVMKPEKKEELKKQARAAAVKKAKEWWENSSSQWKRFDAIVEGLKSDDADLQYRIFQWLRNGDTKCEGLSLESFDKLILPEVERLAKSENENIRKEAELLLESNSKEKWWYRNKLKRDYPDKYATMELK